jgi:hypothetical protein
MMSNLRRMLISWHAGCIDYWYQPNKYYERPIRIHLRSLSTLRRKRPWRPRDFSLCAPYSRCRLLDLAICADSCENLCAWTRAVRSLPYDYDTAFCTELKRGFDLISDALPFGACGTLNRMQSAMQSGTPSFAAVKKMWAATQRDCPHA